MTASRLQAHLPVLCSVVLGLGLCKAGSPSPGGVLAGPASSAAKRDGRLEQEEALALGSGVGFLSVSPGSRCPSRRNSDCHVQGGAHRPGFVMTFQGQQHHLRDLSP